MLFDGRSLFFGATVLFSVPEREKQVIQLGYFHALTQQRVAKIMDISQVQVSRIEKKAIAMLKELMA